MWYFGMVGSICVWSMDIVILLNINLDWNHLYIVYKCWLINWQIVYYIEMLKHCCSPVYYRTVILHADLTVLMMPMWVRLKCWTIVVPVYYRTVMLNADLTVLMMPMWWVKHMIATLFMCGVTEDTVVNCWSIGMGDYVVT